jgi:hypothetical protein
MPRANARAGPRRARGCACNRARIVCPEPGGGCSESLGQEGSREIPSTPPPQPLVGRRRRASQLLSAPRVAKGGEDSLLAPRPGH